ncbi:MULTISPECIES: cytochrome P450 [unclassified Sphingomonas]|uniref:cytochrome P450 n=1 Tax=unclassified Sphingomonas TaxID=196159 RepID=UPI00082DA93D|nr:MULTISPECIES: cytochrome P450 [unclassified Sphingomonas]
MPAISPAELAGGDLSGQQIGAILLYHRHMVARMRRAYPFDPDRRKLQAMVRRYQMGDYASRHLHAVRRTFEDVLQRHPVGTPLPVESALGTPLALAAFNSLLGLDFRVAQLGDALAVGYKALVTGLPVREMLQGWLSYRPVVTAVDQALTTRSYTADGLLAALVAFAEEHERSRDFIIMSCAVIMIAGTSLNRSLASILRFALDEPEIANAIRGDSPDAAFEELMRLYPPLPTIFRYHAEGSAPGCKEFSTIDLSAANRDADQFAEPDSFDPSRKRTAALTFGVGPFSCDGVPMTRIFLRESVRALLTRAKGLQLIDIDGDAPAVIVYDRFE